MPQMHSMHLLYPFRYMQFPIEVVTQLVRLEFNAYPEMHSKHYVAEMGSACKQFVTPACVNDTSDTSRRTQIEKKEVISELVSD